MRSLFQGQRGKAALCLWTAQRCQYRSQAAGKNRRANRVADTRPILPARGIGKDRPGAFLVDGRANMNPGALYPGIDFISGRPVLRRCRRAGIFAMGAIYTIEAEEMKLCHLGNFSGKELAAAQVEKIGNVDILMFPAGGGKDFGAKEALKVVSQIEPSIAIPMNYEIPKLKLEAGNLKEFLKTAGISQTEPLAKLTIKKKEINLEEAKIIVLTP